MNILNDSNNFGTRTIKVEGNADLHIGDKYEGREVTWRHTFQECPCCGDGRVKTLINLQ